MIMEIVKYWPSCNTNSKLFNAILTNFINYGFMLNQSNAVGAQPHRSRSIDDRSRSIDEYRQILNLHFRVGIRLFSLLDQILEGSVDSIEPLVSFLAFRTVLLFFTRSCPLFCNKIAEARVTVWETADAPNYIMSVYVFILLAELVLPNQCRRYILAYDSCDCTSSRHFLHSFHNTNARSTTSSDVCDAAELTPLFRYRSHKP